MKIKAIYNWLVDHICEFVDGSKIVRKGIKKSLGSAKLVLELVRGDCHSLITIGCAVANDGCESYSAHMAGDEPSHFEKLADLIDWLKACSCAVAV